MTRRVSQAKKRRRTTHGQQRGSKMCHKQPQMACRMSHKYAHTHAHTLLLRATIVQKKSRESSRPQLCCTVMALSSSAGWANSSGERDSFQYRANTALTNVQSATWSTLPTLLCRHTPRSVQWSLVYRGACRILFENFTISVAGVFLLMFCSQPQGGFAVLCEASSTFATHCSENLVKKHST